MIIIILFFKDSNRIGGVMASVLVSSAVDHVFQRSCRRIIVTCGFNGVVSKEAYGGM